MLGVGLTDNHMKEQITDLLFGYMGSESLIFKAAEVAAQLKQENPNVFFRTLPVFFITSFFRMLPLFGTHFDRR